MELLTVLLCLVLLAMLFVVVDAVVRASLRRPYHAPRGASDRRIAADRRRAGQVHSVAPKSRRAAVATRSAPRGTPPGLVTTST